MPTVGTLAGELHKKGRATLNDRVHLFKNNAFHERSEAKNSETNRDAVAALMKTLARTLDYLFGCRHTETSWPLTIRPNKSRPRVAFLTGTYVVCLECGQEFPYDWKKMSIISDGDQWKEEKSAIRAERSTTRRHWLWRHRPRHA